MEISQVKSIELCRDKPFEHEIIFRDATGYPIDRFYVKENVGWETFKKVYEAWITHPSFNGTGKEINE